MISVVQAKNTLNKTYNVDGSKTSGARLSNFRIKSFEVKTPTDLANIMKQLQHNEIIISGSTTQQTLPTAKREHFTQGTWYPFDRDYKVTDGTTLELLTQLDPQFNYITYLRKSSASNIIIDKQLQADYREKIWVEFKPGTTHDEVQAYVIKLKKKAFLTGLAKLSLSPNEDSPAIVHEAVFDSSCFRPEALHYEGVPVINNTDITHNTYYEPHVGEQQYLDTSKLHFSTLDDTKYIRLMNRLKAEIKPAHNIRLASVKRTRPQQDWIALDKGFISDDTVLFTIDKQEVSVGKIISRLILGENVTDYTELEYTDPLDPSYHDGTQKAKLYLNEDKTLILHSFAHGSHYYRAAANIALLPETLERLDCNLTKPDIKDKRHTLTVMNRILPYFYIPSLNDVDFIADSLKKVASKAIIQKIIISGAYNPTARIPLEEHPLREYVFLKEGSGKILSLDPEEGMVSMSIEGAKAFLANKHQEFSGAELFDMWIQDPERKDVMSFGLYENDEENKLSMWADFATYELGKQVKEHDIQPFIYHMKLATGEDPQAHIYLSNWIADLVQQPLRSGTRPAIVLHSEAQGTGKGVFFKLISSFFQPFNVVESAKLDALVGRFNNHLMSAVLFGLDEVVATGEFNPTQVTDILKNITTEDRLTVEPKGLNSRQVPNKIHLMVMTNKEFHYLDSQNRRFTVFPFSDKHKQDVVYHKELLRWWDDGGMELTFTYFKQYKLNAELAQVNYKNDATVVASIKQLYGKGGRDRWLFYFLADMQLTEMKLTAKELHQSYMSSYIAATGTEAKAQDMRELTSYLKTEFGDTPAIGYKSNNYIIRRDVFREKFSLRKLNSVDFNWSDYSVVQEEDPNLTKEVKL